MKELNKLEVQDVNGGYSSGDIVDVIVDILDMIDLLGDIF